MCTLIPVSRQVFRDGCQPQLLSISITVPNQQFLPWSDNSKRSVVDMTTVLEGQQVLFYTVSSTVHIPHPV